MICSFQKGDKLKESSIVYIISSVKVIQGYVMF